MKDRDHLNVRFAITVVQKKDVRKNMQARENVFKLGPETWSGPYHILCYNHAKSAALIQFV